MAPTLLSLHALAAEVQENGACALDRVDGDGFNCTLLKIATADGEGNIHMLNLDVRPKDRPVRKHRT